MTCKLFLVNVLLAGGLGIVLLHGSVQGSPASNNARIIAAPVSSTIEASTTMNESLFEASEANKRFVNLGDSSQGLVNSLINQEPETAQPVSTPSGIDEPNTNTTVSETIVSSNAEAKEISPGLMVQPMKVPFKWEVIPGHVAVSGNLEADPSLIWEKIKKLFSGQTDSQSASDTAATQRAFNLSIELLIQDVAEKASISLDLIA